MSWLQLHTFIKPAQAQQLEDVLNDSGALSITYQDRADEPILEPGVGETPLWPSIRATALFEQNVNSTAITKKLRGDLDALQLLYEVEVLQDRNWEREWLQHFKPLRCGDRLWVCPSWHEPPDTNAVNIILDPGLAFGTGTHETTHLCLQWLDQADINEKRVLDFGCGSGILGIAALLLGAKHVVFVDNDPQALAATVDNLAKNGCRESCYTVLHANAFKASGVRDDSSGFDLVIANILAKPLIDLAGSLCAAMAPGAMLVMSGIRGEQQSAVQSAYANDIQFHTAHNENNWLCISGSKAN